MTFGIAVYGKGGIGKSTISANLSYNLAVHGGKVVQVGCDPKHDSTRLLLCGKPQKTVLDMIRTERPKDRKISDVVVEGDAGVHCIEAGGPLAGVGCAGKGIITMFQSLKTMGMDRHDYDYIVYDVLGDVVCGGFAVPMRPDRSDAILIVTSGEFMSLYAANNIMKGLANIDGDSTPRLAGIVFNSRGSPSEEKAVEELSASTGVPIIARVPRSVLFHQAERQGAVVSKLYPDSDEASVFAKLAKTVEDIAHGNGRLYKANPLTDEQLESLAAGMKVGIGRFNSKNVIVPTDAPVVKKPESSNSRRRVGMGPIGAALTAGKITDIPVVIHGSSACGYGMLNEINEARLVALGSDPDMFVGDGSNLFCTRVGSTESIFGGAANLESLLDSLARPYPEIIVITTCLTGMIGDDVNAVIKEIKRRYPDTRVHLVNGDGVESGIDAHMEVLKVAADIVGDFTEKIPNHAMIIDDSFIAFGVGRNREMARMLLRSFNIEVIGEFLNECTIESLSMLRMCSMGFVTEDTKANRAVGAVLESHGLKVMHRPLPCGYHESVSWAEHIGKMKKMADEANKFIERMKVDYSAALDRASTIKKKRIALFSDGTEKISWIEETLSDADCDVRIFHIGGAAVEKNIFEFNSFPVRSVAVSEAEAWAELIIGKPYLTANSNVRCIEFPTTYVSHMASVMLLDRVSAVLSSKGNMGWESWGAPL